MGKRIVLVLILCVSLINALLLVIVTGHQGKMERMIEAVQAEVSTLHISIGEVQADLAERTTMDNFVQGEIALPDADGEYVYIAIQHGKKYHSSENCRGLSSAKEVSKMRIEELSTSMERCKICYAE